MPATTYSPTHFRVQYIGPAGLTFLFGIGNPRFLRKLNLRIAAGSRCLDGFDDSLNIRPKAWPLLQAENHDRDSTTRKVLLVRHVLVGGQQYFEPVRLCGRK